MICVDTTDDEDRNHHKKNKIQTHHIVGDQEPTSVNVLVPAGHDKSLVTNGGASLEA